MLIRIGLQQVDAYGRQTEEPASLLCCPRERGPRTQGDRWEAHENFRAGAGSPDVRREGLDTVLHCSLAGRGLCSAIPIAIWLQHVLKAVLFVDPTMEREKQLLSSARIHHLDVRQVPCAAEPSAIAKNLRRTPPSGSTGVCSDQHSGERRVCDS